MKNREIGVVLDALRDGKTTARGAVAQLVAGGVGITSAQEMVFIALGGDDIIETDNNGRKRYRHSGKLVEEVDRLARL